MDLKSISTINLIEELESRKSVASYDCGIYKEHETQIKRKYSNTRGFVELPDNYKLIVICDF